MYGKWQFRVMIVTLINFLLLNAFFPQDSTLVWKHLRKVFLVAQAMLFYLISSTLADTEEIAIANKYLSFGITFLILYFFHTHEYVGEQD